MSTQGRVKARYNLECTDPDLGQILLDFKDNSIYGLQIISNMTRHFPGPVKVPEAQEEAKGLLEVPKAPKQPGNPLPSSSRKIVCMQASMHACLQKHAQIS